MRNIRIIILAMALGLLAFAVSASGQSFTFGLRPEDQSQAYFEYTLEAGESLEDAVLAVNGTEQVLALSIQPVDGRTALRGGISFPGTADGTASWIHMPDAGVLDVPVDAALRLPFTVTVPEGTPPGEYVAGILSTPENPEQLSGKSADDGAFRVQVIPQMGVSIIIHVPGEERCEVTMNGVTNEVEKGEWKVTLNLLNSGNIHFRGTGAYILRPKEGGAPALEHTFDIGYFIAGDEMAYPLYFEQVPAEGDYSSEVLLVGGDCSFRTTESEDISLDAEMVKDARNEAKKWAAARQEADGAEVVIQEQPNILLSAGIFLFGLAALLLVVFLGYRSLAARKAQPAESESGPALTPLDASPEDGDEQA